MTDQPTPDPVPTPVAQRSWVIPAVAGLVGLLVGIGGTLAVQSVSAAGPDEAAADTRLEDAKLECNPASGVELGDDGRTLTIDVKGKEDAYGADYEDLACILNELDVPSRVSSHLGQTTSMDGRQTESWDGVTAAWSYHPDRGSDMVITLDDPEE